MRFFRTFLILLSTGVLAIGGSACAGEVSDSPEASTTTGVSPNDVQEPSEGGGSGGEDEEAPADPSAPPTNPGGVNY